MVVLQQPPKVEMDPCGIQDTIRSYATSITTFADEAKRNKSKCQLVKMQVENIKLSADKITNLKPDRAWMKLIFNLKDALKGAEEIVKKYSQIRRALSVVFAHKIKREFANVNEALDQLQHGKMCEIFRRAKPGPPQCAFVGRSIQSKGAM